MINKFQTFSIFIFLFIYVFGSKFLGILDYSILVCLLFTFIAAIQNRLFISNLIFDINYIFLLISSYALFVSIVNLGGEIFFALKFSKIIILFLVSTFFADYLVKYFRPADILRFIVLAAILHSIIIIMCIFIPPFRELIYDFSGYIPRGPAWSRSPGITLGFNSTVIVHILALYLLLNYNLFKSCVTFLLCLILIISFIFLGRTMVIVGMALILGLGLITKPIKYSFFLMLTAVCLYLIFNFLNTQDLDSNNDFGIFLINLNHLLKVFDMSSSYSIYNYGENALGGHMYFADNINTLLWGNSYAGHLGILDPIGQTDSDIGIINSINANGLIVTSLLYVIYFILCSVRQNVFRTEVVFLSILSVVLSFKETGLFDAHITPVLFILFHTGQRYKRYE